MYYFLEDVEGDYEDGYHISCQMEGTWSDGSKRRVLYFPSGYFALDNQVWLSPLTKIVGKAAPNDSNGDTALGEQTLFIAYASGTADDATDYDSFNIYDALVSEVYVCELFSTFHSNYSLIHFIRETMLATPIKTDIAYHPQVIIHRAGVQWELTPMSSNSGQDFLCTLQLTLLI